MVWSSSRSSNQFFFLSNLCLFVGVACLCSFSLGMLPFVQAFAPVMLLFELSTIFLNNHWFMEKTGRSGTWLQFINGLLLLASFFLVRICWGTFKLGQAVMILMSRRAEVEARIGWGLVEFYGVAGVGIGVLNFIWFSAMVRSVSSKFTKKSKSKSKTN